MAFDWARRSFAAATMLSALVIFCVDLTEPMRILRALREAMNFQSLIPFVPSEVEGRISTSLDTNGKGLGKLFP